MKARVQSDDPGAEYYFDEGCFITELSNTADDPSVSVARARLEPGRTTRWHYLRHTTERYVLLHGCGRVEVEGMAAREVGPNDVVLIPPGARQRIRNTGECDLIFLAICSPRFEVSAYVDADDTQAL